MKVGYSISPIKAKNLPIVRNTYTWMYFLLRKLLLQRSLLLESGFWSYLFFGSFDHNPASVWSHSCVSETQSVWFYIIYNTSLHVWNNTDCTTWIMTATSILFLFWHIYIFVYQTYCRSLSTCLEIKTFWDHRKHFIQVILRFWPVA